MLAAARLCPLLGDELRGEILRIGLLDLVVLVHGEHSERGGRCVVTAQRLAQRNVVEIVDRLSTCIEKRAHKISPPERGKNVQEGFVGFRANVGLADKHRYAWGKAIVTPDLEDVAGKIRLIEELGPLELASFRGVMFERDE